MSDFVWPLFSSTSFLFINDVFDGVDRVLEVSKTSEDCIVVFGEEPLFHKGIRNREDDHSPIFFHNPGILKPSSEVSTGNSQFHFDEHALPKLFIIHMKFVAYIV